MDSLAYSLICQPVVSVASLRRCQTLSICRSLLSMRKNRVGHGGPG